MIVRGTVGPNELTPETLNDPDILRISRATELIDDPELTALSADKRWAEVALVLRDGRRIQGEPLTPRGDVDLPATGAEISAKFHLFADGVLGQQRAAEMEDLCGRFDTLDAQDLDRLMDLCLNEPAK